MYSNWKLQMYLSKLKIAKCIYQIENCKMYLSKLKIAKCICSNWKVCTLWTGTSVQIVKACMHARCSASKWWRCEDYLGGFSAFIKVGMQLVCHMQPCNYATMQPCNYATMLQCSNANMLQCYMQLFLPHGTQPRSEGRQSVWCTVEKCLAL